ncbi:MAG: hypothetical protein WCH35_00250 [Comamonadaceae bacterium]
MHNAPAVSYPVGRSRFQGGLIGLTTLGAAVAGLLWYHQADPVVWLRWLFAFTLGLTGSAAANFWYRAPTGTLSWDGRVWSWDCGKAPISGVVTVYLDLQYFMLLSLRTDVGERIWLWPERRNEAIYWNALRQAVFSRGATANPNDTSVIVDLTDRR